MVCKKEGLMTFKSFTMAPAGKGLISLLQLSGRHLHLALSNQAINTHAQPPDHSSQTPRKPF